MKGCCDADCEGVRDAAMTSLWPEVNWNAGVETLAVRFTGWCMIFVALVGLLWCLARWD